MGGDIDLHVGEVVDLVQSSTHPTNNVSGHRIWCRRDKYSLGEPPTEFGLGVQSMLEWLALIYHSIGYTKIDVDTSGGETWKS